MERVRVGIVGLGNMGSFHVSYTNSIDGAVLAAVCDADRPRVDRTVSSNAGVRGFATYQEMLDSGAIDAVIIATPHFQHGEISRAAFARNIHVLCEKPLAVTINDARRTVEAYQQAPHLKFSLMFQQRANPLYRKMRQLIAEEELGEVTRISWIVTDWFRTWSYYASGGWRATWAGEGGGVLINQCPHNLDLIQWVPNLFPSRVTAVASLGKTHPIEVEDEVSAILEYANGAVGHFVTSTGEAPGTNRLEICGDRGKLIAENGKLSFVRTRRSVREIRETDPAPFASVEAWTIDIDYKSGGPEGHKVMTQNFINAILRDEPLIGPGVDGVKGLELGNAMLMSGVTRKPVDLPLDGDGYDQLLKDLTARYGGRKKLDQRESVVADMSASFSKP
jgi:predicted dehydrogenase